MAKFSPTEAVFAGFRFVRERPATLLIWSAFLLVVLALALVAMFDLGGDQMTALVQASQAVPFDPALITKLSQDIFPASAFALLLTVVFGSVLVTAILRVRLESATHPWGGLRFGGDELRVLGANVMVILAVFLAETLVGMAADLGARVGVPVLRGLAVWLAGGAPLRWRAPGPAGGPPAQRRARRRGPGPPAATRAARPAPSRRAGGRRARGAGRQWRAPARSGRG
jgi:hypothetical protein